MMRKIDSLYKKIKQRKEDCFFVEVGDGNIKGWAKHGFPDIKLIGLSP